MGLGGFDHRAGVGFKGEGGVQNDTKVAGQRGWSVGGGVSGECEGSSLAHLVSMSRSSVLSLLSFGEVMCQPKNFLWRCKFRCRRWVVGGAGVGGWGEVPGVSGGFGDNVDLVKVTPVWSRCFRELNVT